MQCVWGFLLFFWGRGLMHWVLGILVKESQYQQIEGTGLSVTNLTSQCWYCLLKLTYVERWGEKWHYQHLWPWKGDFVLATLREVLPEEWSTSLLESQVCFGSLFSYFLSLVCFLPGARQCTLAPTQPSLMTFKTQTLGTCSDRDLNYSSKVGITTLGLMQVWPRRTVVPECRGMGFGGKQAIHPVSWLAALSRYLWEGEGNGTHWLFCLQRSILQMPSYTDVLQVEQTLSQCTLDDPQIMQSAPRFLVCLLARNRAASSGLYPSQDHQPPKLQSLSPADFKHAWKSALILSQTMALGKCSLCVYPCVLHFFPLAFLHDQGSLSSTATLTCFFPKPPLSTSYLPWCGPFTPSTCAVYSFNPQVHFLGIQNDFIVIKLYLRDKATLRSSYYSTILTSLPDTCLVSNRILPDIAKHIQ